MSRNSGCCATDRSTCRDLRTISYEDKSTDEPLFWESLAFGDGSLYLVTFDGAYALSLYDEDYRSRDVDWLRCLECVRLRSLVFTAFGEHEHGVVSDDEALLGSAFNRV